MDNPATNNGFIRFKNGTASRAMGCCFSGACETSKLVVTHSI